MRALARERIQMYDRRVQEAVDSLLENFPEAAKDESLWPGIKLAYIGLLHEHHQPECAETFYNSVACAVLHRRHYHNEFIFWRPAVATEHLEGESPSYRCYDPLQDGLRNTLRKIVGAVDLKNAWEDLPRDLRSLVRALRAHFPRPARAQPDLQIQVLASLFFRNKAAYIIGRVVNAHREVPFAVPILQSERGELYLDTLLAGEDQLLILFSFARAYFFVDMEVPAAYISFLRWVLPKKPRTELYMSVGLGKQGKTLFYRDLLQHLHHSQDAFVEAPGIRGQVMLVFTLPSYPYVFKVIKDAFGPGKNTDRATVRSKFTMVKHVDRVGRMADTHEFTDLTLPRGRFSNELLALLNRLAPSMIEDDGATITVRHCYAERRMVPLNIYLDRATPGEVEPAVIEYGNAIRDLAIANIFPGDMLWRNFGVTRDGRVVFYDYDEIEYLTDCNFRRVPEAHTEEEEMSGEVWYAVGPKDVFPETFAPFLLGNPSVREVFLKHHADLLDPAFWQHHKERILAGHVHDVFPYDASRRFVRQRRREALGVAT